MLHFGHIATREKIYDLGISKTFRRASSSSKQQFEVRVLVKDVPHPNFTKAVDVKVEVPNQKKGLLFVFSIFFSTEVFKPKLTQSFFFLRRVRVSSGERNSTT